jgi:hypothetical protein
MSATKLKPPLQPAPIVQHWISGRVASSDGSRTLDVINPGLAACPVPGGTCHRTCKTKQVGSGAHH